MTSLLDPANFDPVVTRCERGDHTWCEHAGPELPIMVSDVQDGDSS